jgi:ribosome-binding protein aMBF1 (putative translation factor)
MARKSRRGPYMTKGRQALNQKLTSGEYSQSSLARALGLKQPSIYAWSTGEARPEAQHRQAMERLLGIEAHLWMTADEYETAFGVRRVG